MIKTKRVKEMNNSKKKRLESNGWKVGSTAEFLNLSPEEAAYIELKLALSKALQDLRKSKNLTQIELAKRIKSSQSRVSEDGSWRCFSHYGSYVSLIICAWRIQKESGWNVSVMISAFSTLSL